MRFLIGYTNEPDNARYPAGTVEGEPRRWGRGNEHSIEVTTIEQLLAIQEEFGDLIITGTAADGYGIEIYNDYRE